MAQIDCWPGSDVGVRNGARATAVSFAKGREGKIEKGRRKTILRLKGQIVPKPYHSFPVIDSRYDSPSPTTGGAAVCPSSHSRSWGAVLDDIVVSGTGGIFFSFIRGLRKRGVRVSSCFFFFVGGRKFEILRTGVIFPDLRCGSWGEEDPLLLFRNSLFSCVVYADGNVNLVAYLWLTLMNIVRISIYCK